jgi:hypothetical protein
MMTQHQREKSHPMRRAEDVPAHPMRRATDRPSRPAGVGAYINGLLLSKKPNDEVLVLTQRTFPEARTSAATVAWYKAKLKKAGKLD